MWYPKFIKQMRCKHEWSESFLLEYDAKHDWMFRDDAGQFTVSAKFCLKCGKAEYYKYVGVPGRESREEWVSIKEFHRMRRRGG